MVPEANQGGFGGGEEVSHMLSVWVIVVFVGGEEGGALGPVVGLPVVVCQGRARGALAEEVCDETAHVVSRRVPVRQDRAEVGV